MCTIITGVVDLPNGERTVSLICARTKKPVSLHKEDGMYCEDLCDLGESKTIDAQIQDLKILFEENGFKFDG